MPEPMRTDPQAPQSIEVILSDPTGPLWGKIIAFEKVFSTGAIGYYSNGFIVNPISKERYWANFTFTLQGSKPEIE